MQVNITTIILDVRTPEEFSSGHTKGAPNIPIDRLRENIDMLKAKATPIIACCRSELEPRRS